MLEVGTLDTAATWNCINMFMIYMLHLIYGGDKMKDDETGAAYGRQGGERQNTQGFGGET
jgi:hypothetical protein